VHGCCVFLLPVSKKFFKDKKFFAYYFTNEIRKNNFQKGFL